MFFSTNELSRSVMLAYMGNSIRGVTNGLLMRQSWSYLNGDYL